MFDAFQASYLEQLVEHYAKSAADDDQFEVKITITKPDGAKQQIHIPNLKGFHDLGLQTAQETVYDTDLSSYIVPKVVLDSAKNTMGLLLVGRLLPGDTTHGEVQMLQKSTLWGWDGES